MEPIIKMYVISNPRTPEGGWKNETGCDICGKISSAYAGVQEKSSIVMAICKGCLLNGVKLIDKDLLDQAKKRV
jgi:transcription elongation factor Elf1